MFVQGGKGGQSVLFCLNRGDGKVVWTANQGRALTQDKGNGPRGTPTIDQDRVYSLTENGDLCCWRIKDGSSVWRKNILQEFGGRNPSWLISESPLIDGDRIIVTPGGRGAGIVALEKMTGKLVWACKELSDEAGYASCIAGDIDGVRTIMNLTSRAGVGVRASDGKLMWHYEKVANDTANCATPVLQGNRVFYSSDYGTGCAALDLKAQRGSVEAHEAYFSRDMKNHHGGIVLYNGHLYGFSDAILTCLEFATGKMMWRNRSVGKGSLTIADGYLHLVSENNIVGLAEATHEGYYERGRFSIPDKGWPSWAHPVVCGGKLYIRNQDTLTCYNIKGS